MRRHVQECAVKILRNVNEDELTNFQRVRILCKSHTPSMIFSWEDLNVAFVAVTTLVCYTAVLNLFLFCRRSTSCNSAALTATSSNFMVRTAPCILTINLLRNH